MCKPITWSKDTREKRYFLRSVLMRFLLAVALVLDFGPVAGAQSQLPKLKFTDTTLNNGLRVIILPDHFAPVFSIAVSYNTGSRNEREGRTGFAHLFEHMMFQGSANVGKGEHAFLIQSYGGMTDATTDTDRTLYYEELPRNQLDLALFLESDRMRTLN